MDCESYTCLKMVCKCRYYHAYKITNNCTEIKKDVFISITTRKKTTPVKLLFETLPYTLYLLLIGSQRSWNCLLHNNLIEWIIFYVRNKEILACKWKNISKTKTYAFSVFSFSILRCIVHLWSNIFNQYLNDLH